MLPVFVFTIKYAGELVLRAERKVQPSTLIPDVDNAAVGNDFTLLQEDAAKGILLLFIFLRKEETVSTDVAD